MTVECVKKLPKLQQKIVDSEWKKFDQQSWGKAYVTHEYGGDYYFLAKKGEELLGIAHVLTEGGVVCIDEFLVFEAHRGRGVGSMLMGEVIKFANNKKQHKVYLETDPKSQAVSFYKKHGFFIEATLKNHYGKQDGIVMSLFVS